ncbi:substrate-binding periplasmic protein [Marinobacter xestospongiae]|uniref:substrate-binding periplasmic protein n=1 Tax=Marinobacter xestospongiae TaxID=994319 RepID=UPI002002C651|nr:transporter substrate-binding domain-containing protein [Marinobacter xestospongiae]MCK7566682.1 transporter substrate-binding domain-containing protein [Marinobacter xestospongiae]
MLNRPVFFAALSFLASLVTLEARAEPANLTIVTAEFPPYEYSRGDAVVGIDTDTVCQVIHRMGLNANIEMLPWRRAIKQVEDGFADMIYSLTYSDQRTEDLLFTAPLSLARDVLFKRRDWPFSWQQLDDLSGQRIGLSESYNYPSEFMAWIARDLARITRISHEQPDLTSLRMLARGRIDLFICEQKVCEYLIAHHRDDMPELANLEALPTPVAPPRQLRAAFSRRNPQAAALRDRFDQALAELRAEQTAH